MKRLGTLLFFILLFSSLFFPKKSSANNNYDFELTSEKNWNGQDAVKIRLLDNDKHKIGYNGSINFIINGITIPLSFKGGKADLSEKLEGSLFVYIKKQKREGKIYIISKFLGGIYIFRLPAVILLILIGLTLIAAYSIGKIGFWAIIIIIAYMFFNGKAGTWIEIIKDRIMNLI